MAWGADTSGGTQKTGLGTTWSAFNKISLNPRELAHVEIIADNENASTVTDALEVRVVTTLDASTEDWDDSPVMGFTYEPATVAAEKFSFQVAGFYAFRVEVRSSGSTDTYTVDCNYRVDGVSA